MQSQEDAGGLLFPSQQREDGKNKTEKREGERERERESESESESRVWETALQILMLTYAEF